MEMNYVSSVFFSFFSFTWYEYIYYHSQAHGRDIKRNEAASKGNAKEGLSVKSLTTKFEHYPDVIDIAGMDYSPAKRRPPIHNWSWDEQT